MTANASWFIQAQTFAAPFCSDTVTRYIEAKTAADALECLADTFTHPAGLYSAAAWPTADAMHKGEKPVAIWLCNHEAEKRRLTEGLGCFTYRGMGPGRFEIDGTLHVIDNPKSGMVRA